MKNPVCSRCAHHSLCAGKVPIFGGLNEDELRRIVRMTGHREYPKGETLILEGAVSDTLYIVNEGLVKLTKMSRDGREQILRILKAGDFFGELNIFGGGQPVNFSASAVSNTKICSLTRERMDEILRDNPAISVKLLGSLSRRLAQTENLAHNLSSHDADARTAFVLLELAGNHGVAESGGVRITLPVGREELAAYAGLTRETLSRKLSLFEKKGFLRSEGPRSLFIPDTAQIEDFL